MMPKHGRAAHAAKKDACLSKQMARGTNFLDTLQHYNNLRLEFRLKCSIEYVRYETLTHSQWGV
jgi:hypothetical protein